MYGMWKQILLYLALLVFLQPAQKHQRYFMVQWLFMETGKCTKSFSRSPIPCLFTQSANYRFGVSGLRNRHTACVAEHPSVFLIAVKHWIEMVWYANLSYLKLASIATTNLQTSDYDLHFIFTAKMVQCQHG